MTRLSITDPLRSLRALCGLSHRALGERVSPPVSDVAIIKAEQRAGRIKLSTLAAYARAAGYMLRVEARFWLGEERDKARLYSARGDLFAGTVEGLRGDLAALGLEMTLATLAVEPAAEAKR